MFYLKRNLPIVERLIRIALGLGAAVLTAKMTPLVWIAIAGYATALTLIGTAVFGYCPACAMLGRKPVVSARGNE